MEPNKPKFRFRLNLFDSIVLVLALAVGAFLVWSAIKPAAAPAEGAVSAAGTVQYTIRFQKMIQGASERIKPRGPAGGHREELRAGHSGVCGDSAGPGSDPGSRGQGLCPRWDRGLRGRFGDSGGPLYRGRGLPPAGRRLQAAGGRDRLCPGLRLYGQRAVVSIERGEQG